MGLATWGVPSTHLSSPSSYPPLFSPLQSPNPQVDLQPNSRPACLPCLLYLVTKFATPGHGTMIVRTTNAPYVTFVSFASAIIKRLLK